MIEKLLPHFQNDKETVKRSVLKAVSYRLIILVLDFFSIYFFTGQTKIALGFMIVSNIYTSIVYFFHERVWNKIKWGKSDYKKTEQ